MADRIAPRFQTIRRRLGAALAAGLLLTVGIPPAVAASLGSKHAAASADTPAAFSADEVGYDNELGIISARGHVEVIYGERVLLADVITYNQKTNVVAANGNVSLTEPSGDVLFAEYVELTSDFKEGVIRDLRVLMSDSSRVAARSGTRTGGNVTEMRKAVYSPCFLCPDDPTRPPLWQVRAEKVIHNQDRQTMEYYDAWLDVAGWPVGYVPYISHPDPTVRRKAGFLAPHAGASNRFGYVARLPYYYPINDQQDLTLTPSYTTKQGPILAGEYRQLMKDGKFNATASITEDSEDKVRGHVMMHGLFDIDDTWRWGMDAERSSDDTYTRQYGYESKRTLTSRLFAEGFRRRNYMAANAYAFQGLDIHDDPGTTPWVAPMFEYSHVGETDRLGGRSNLDLNLLGLTRTDGTDTRRMHMDAGWKRPMVGPEGGLYSVSASLRGDLYHVSDHLLGNSNQGFDGPTGRVVPSAEVDWSYPLVRRESTATHQVIEPMASAIVSPYGGNSPKIPNEDSLELEFDDTNLFSSNRFAGLDRVEGGPRLNYGLKWGLYGAGGGRTAVMVGQSYRFKRDDTFGSGSGLEDNFSDYVGRVQVEPVKYLNLYYRTRLNKDDLSPNRHEVMSTVGVPALNLGAGYLFFERQQDTQFGEREQMRLQLSSMLTRTWQAALFGVHDFVDGETRTFGASLIYEDECLILGTDLKRETYRDRDLEPSDSIMFRIMFKTLGEVSSGVSGH